MFQSKNFIKLRYVLFISKENKLLPIENMAIYKLSISFRAAEIVCKDYLFGQNASFYKICHLKHVFILTVL
jgi:hypothetical protein